MSEAAAPSFRRLTYTARDGLRLALRHYGDPAAAALPVACLPGLTRTARDFHALAMRLAADPAVPRRVVAFDYRGRGESEWDPDPSRYNPLTELQDVLDGLDLLGIRRAAIVGTSRGGILAMLMPALRPGLLAAAVLNDIGPELEPAGLSRIRAYVGAGAVPADWPAAVAAVRRLHGASFPALDAAGWEDFARLTYRDAGGRPERDHDPALRVALGPDDGPPPPTLWEQFAALAAVPVLAIRGAESDLLSAATLARMAALHPALQSITVPGEGHPPQLAGPLLDRIASFLAALD